MSLASELREFIDSGTSYKNMQIPDLSGEDIVKSIEEGGDLKVIPSSEGKISTVEDKHNNADFGKNADAFPFHADGAYYSPIPRYVILYCARTGGSGGETFFTETTSVIKSLRAKFDPNLIDSLHIIYMGGDNRKYRRPLIEKVDNREILHWYSSLYLEPDLNKLSIDNRKSFTRLAAEVSMFLDENLSKEVKYEHSWTEGDLLVFDNQRVLHGRREIKDPGSKRFLYRIWFDYAKVVYKKDFLPE